MAKNKVSKHEVDGKDQETRRTLLKGIAGSVPVIMTVASRPVFGQSTCTPSADFSAAATPSGLERHGGVCPQGLSAGAWKTASGNGDGSLNDWHLADAHPNPEYEASPKKNPKKKGRRATASVGHNATMFSELGPGFTGTLHDALLNDDNSNRASPLQRHAAAALLNARYNENSGNQAFPGYMRADDVRLLYQAAYYGAPSYTNASGYTVHISGQDITAFFASITGG